jgi:hypothetical protein
MNNLNSITRGHPEYYILRRKINLMLQMGLTTDIIHKSFRERYKLSKRVLRLLFPKPVMRIPLASISPYWSTPSPKDISLYKKYVKQSTF